VNGSAVGISIPDDDAGLDPSLHRLDAGRGPSLIDAVLFVAAWVPVE